ncbi:uncharacterized protein T551_01342 [Pneumocystis jirovecii RU7]|uniref:mRNA export factor MEX67 n=1 Tax=Pneumocystis jirovecii (strain RU7) TaxID=1408657 RepID=A0A0W4ZSA7_PNEJ7|nr:uncharacterized protein T551_01342 [Pneumocystis jirovecii RU7]KTW31270.1 hypothetical protein T551_01342 [Pneumocystis jirovecii RU7]
MHERWKRGGRASWRSQARPAVRDGMDPLERDGDIEMTDEAGGLRERFTPYRTQGRAKKLFKERFRESPTEIVITGHEGASQEELVSFISRKSQVLITDLRSEGSVLYAHVPSGSSIRSLLKLSGTRFAGKNLCISISNASKDHPMPMVSGHMSLSASKESTMNILRRFLSSRYSHETKMLDLSSVHSDPALVEAGMFSSTATSLKMFPALMKIAEREFPNVISVNLSSNKISSLFNISILAQIYPNLKNLNLADNLLKHYKDLDVWSHKNKFPNLQELILIGNGVRENEVKKGNEVNYRSEITRRFPNLKLLDMVPVTQAIEFDIKDSAIDNSGKVALLERICSSFFDSDLTRNTVMSFLEKYFSLYDNDRSNTVSMYDQNALFSISINTIAPRKREKGVFSYGASQFSQYISMSRNLLRLGTLEARIAKLNVGRTNISQVLSALPKTRHNFTDSNLYCVDAWSLKGVLSADSDPNGLVGIQIILHGEFFELGSRREIKRSYDRTFIIGPNNGNITIRSDILVIRAYGGNDNFHINKQNVPLSSSNIFQEQQKQYMLAEISKKTGLNQQFSLMCLEQNEWDMEKAINNFNILKNKGVIPLEAFK